MRSLRRRLLGQPFRGWIRQRSRHRTPCRHLLPSSWLPNAGLLEAAQRAAALRSQRNGSGRYPPDRVRWRVRAAHDRRFVQRVLQHAVPNARAVREREDGIAAPTRWTATKTSAYDRRATATATTATTPRTMKRSDDIDGASRPDADADLNIAPYRRCTTRATCRTRSSTGPGRAARPRVDVYDANTRVLRDRFALVPIERVSDLDAGTAPDNMDADNAVYFNASGAVAGFRDLDGRFYDAWVSSWPGHDPEPEKSRPSSGRTVCKMPQFVGLRAAGSGHFSLALASRSRSRTSRSSSLTTT